MGILVDMREAVKDGMDPSRKSKVESGMEMREWWSSLGQVTQSARTSMVCGGPCGIEV